ncbi:MAG: sodium:proton antiporter [Fibromonadaceae bacterium]|jgi:Na+/H+ antiporter NhaD/arsenite permease-like protein|nr:sodium:proton antiporter [Fibromonadaceae bacterium]
MKNKLIMLLAVIFLLPNLALASAGERDTSRCTKECIEKAQGREAAKKKPEPYAADAPMLYEKAMNMSILWVIPFAGILLSIAFLPLFVPTFWHSHYGKVSLFWGVVFFAAFSMNYGLGISFFYLVETYAHEYIPFICLLLALFTISSGIRLKGDLVGTPVVNLILLSIGTCLASIMGTTGAAMLLIRPVLRSNSWRKNKVHIVVFFIFLVANIGGSLTPLGDPPLFLGYLRGIDFTWTLFHMGPVTAFAVVFLLVFFFIMDTYYYKKETNKPPKGSGEKLSIEGKRNFLFFPLVMASVLFSSLDLGIAFVLYYVNIEWASLGQILSLLAITFVSFKITPKEVLAANDFNWEPIIEVSKLFASIFITMVPVLAMLKVGAEAVSFDPTISADAAGPLGMVIKSIFDSNGNPIDLRFFWVTSSLSVFLDNAPTYLVFFQAAGGDAIELMCPGHRASTLLALSIGTVFIGGCSYIANAPNFMVKNIAEQSGVEMPSFFGYIFKYSMTILIPLLLLITFFYPFILKITF